MGKESALPYGQAIYKQQLEALAAALEDTFEDFLLAPSKARPNGDAIPYFDPFNGVHHIAAVTLTAALDQLSRKQRLATFCQNLGKAIENEHRKNHYHRPSDDLSRPIDWDSAVRFARANARIGYAIASEENRPTWNEGDFFGEKFGR